MSSARITPMMQQYRSIKEQYPDAILFYRMGDFYEMFFEDAEIASKALQIALTSRNKHDSQPVPMCGVPCKAARGYLARLIEQGFKVAICDQTEQPGANRGLVRREVVRVVTPGMLVEEELLEAGVNNWLLALHRHGAALGVACIDLSTGALRLCQSANRQAVQEELTRIGAREIIVSEALREDGTLQPLIGQFQERRVSFLDAGWFEYGAARQRLLALLGTLNLEGFGCEDLKAGVGAAGALVAHAQESQQQPLGHLGKLETYHLEDYLLIDETSCRNLELLANLRSGQRKGSLLGVLDRTATAMGSRLLRHWLRYPLRDGAAIAARHDALAEMVAAIATFRRLHDLLNMVQDLERLLSRITLNQASARELLALKRSLQVLPEVQRALAQRQSLRLAWPESSVAALMPLADRLERAVREDAPLSTQEGGMIQSGFDAELDELIAISREGKGGLARLEAEERQRTGINSLKVRYNRVFGYYIEVSKSQTTQVPEAYQRRQTLANAERYVTEALKTYEARVLGAEEQRATLERKIFDALRADVVACAQEIVRMAAFLAELDALLSLALVAVENRYCRPEIVDDGSLWVEQGRHPVVEQLGGGDRFVPNTLRMDDQEQQVLIITGPNMAGKSTVLRQMALIVVMAQMGSFVPAQQASLGLVDRIFTRIGALDDLSQGQSTFMVEMQETARILNSVTHRSLVVLDEIGRGTSTFDGLSIAWAVAEHLHDVGGNGVKTLFATHYHELTELAERKARVKNYHIAVKEWNEQIIFLRSLVSGGTNRSYGIQVARLAGVPDTVLRRAREVLQRVESTQPQVATSMCRREPNARTRPQPPVQLPLFRQPLQALLEDLRQLEIGRMTPLDAINRLGELQQRAAAIPL